MERKCNECALKNIQGGACPIFQADMTGENGCPNFTSKIEFCEICGNIIIKGGTYQNEDDGIWHLMCDRCANADPCAKCVNANICAFETDQSCPEPIYITQTQRQGNMVIQNQIPNPKRIELTCAKDCHCYNPEGAKEGIHCFKQFSCGCKNMKINWRK